MARWLIDTRTKQKYAWEADLARRPGFVEVDGDNQPVDKKPPPPQTSPANGPNTLHLKR